MLPADFLPAQSRDTDNLSAGKLLVASRNIGDPQFARTVILLVRYDAKGVLGLMLNRRTHVPLSRVLENLKAAKDRSDPVFLGGPVETPAVFALFKPQAKLEGAEHVFDGVYLITAKALFEQTVAARPDPGVFHVYLGYAGWSQEQLRQEVELGAWFIFPAEASTVFNADPDSLWLEMIRRTEMQFARSETKSRQKRGLPKWVEFLACRSESSTRSLKLKRSPPAKVPEKGADCGNYMEAGIGGSAKEMQPSNLAMVRFAMRNYTSTKRMG